MVRVPNWVKGTAAALALAGGATVASYPPDAPVSTPPYEVSGTIDHSMMMAAMKAASALQSARDTLRSRSLRPEIRERLLSAALDSVKEYVRLLERKPQLAENTPTWAFAQAWTEANDVSESLAPEAPDSSVEGQLRTAVNIIRKASF